MKEYRVVVVDDREGKGFSKEGTFTLIPGREGQEFVIHYYAERGFRLVHVQRHYTDIFRQWYMYFEKDLEN